jgi:hypothetical protein
MISDEYIAEAEMRARRFSGQWTGTSWTLAADVIRLIHHIRGTGMIDTVEDGIATEMAADRVYQTINRSCPVKAAEPAQDNTKKFSTGAVRSGDAEQVRYDLISPIGLEAVARTCAEGARKYSDFNWERGMPTHDLLNHAIRHIYKFLAGDRSEDHLPHAAWNLLAAIHSEELWPDINRGTLRGPGCRPPAGDQAVSS